MLRSALLVLLIDVYGSVAHPLGVAEKHPHLRIHVNGIAAVSIGTLKLAESEASRLLGPTVPIEWLNCHRTASACHQKFMPGDIVLDIVPTSQAVSRNALGGAIAGDMGVYAVILYERILAVRRPDAPVFSVLGKVMAHEITHLLLGPNSHASTGLMRPLWHAEEFGIDKSLLWFYTPEQRSAMRQGLIRRASALCVQGGS